MTRVNFNTDQKFLEMFDRALEKLNYPTRTHFFHMKMREAIAEAKKKEEA